MPYAPRASMDHGVGESTKLIRLASLQVPNPRGWMWRVQWTDQEPRISLMQATIPITTSSINATTVSPQQFAQKAEAKSIGSPFPARIMMGSCRICVKETEGSETALRGCGGLVAGHMARL